MINRFSSRLHPLDATFLNARLIGAQSYDRVAGYFSSSILEVAGEALESVVGPIRMVCNSELDERDVITARAAKNGIRREWCDSRSQHSRTALLFNHDHFGRPLRALLGDKRLECAIGC